MMGKISLQRMQLVAGCIHVLRHAGYVKSSKKSVKAVGMFWLDSDFGAGIRKAFQPLVPIALYHSYGVWLHYTICQQYIWLHQLKVRLLRDSSLWPATMALPYGQVAGQMQRWLEENCRRVTSAAAEQSLPGRRNSDRPACVATRQRQDAEIISPTR